MKWFTADTHLGHEKLLAGPRGDHFESIESADECILGWQHKVIGKGDILYVLGDMGFAKLQQWRKRMPKCQIWLIKGNHDPSDKQCREAFGREFRQTLMTSLKGHPCWLSHYAHVYWPSSHRGSMHLYGHTHSQRESTLNWHFPERRSMDVGVDNAYLLTGEFRPFSEDEIYDRLMSRRGHDLMEFYEALGSL